MQIPDHYHFIFQIVKTEPGARYSSIHCDPRHCDLGSVPSTLPQEGLNYLQLQELYERRQVLEDEIAALYRKWEALAAELEEARG